jgi:hypothetical protein
MLITIVMGFLDFVARHRPGEALFHSRPEGKERSSSPGATAAGQLAAWVRGLGIDDSRVPPWRHRLKTEGRACCMKDNNLDAIQGHLNTSQGVKYGDSRRA